MAQDIDKQRIEKIKKYLTGRGVKFIQQELVEKLDISKGTVSKMFNGHVGVSDTFYKKFLDYYKLPYEEYFSHDNTREFANSINLKAIDPTDEETYVSKAGMHFIPNKDGSFTMLTPHVTEFARAGYLGRYFDDGYIESLPPFPIQVSEIHRGVYRSFTVVGESMDNGLKGSLGDGDVVTGRLIQRYLWQDTKLHLKKVNYFIINHEEGILVKQIIDHDVDAKTITIRSLNPDKTEYPDVILDLNRIREIYNVVYRSEKM